MTARMLEGALVALAWPAAPSLPAVVAAGHTVGPARHVSGEPDDPAGPTTWPRVRGRLPRQVNPAHRRGDAARP